MNMKRQPHSYLEVRLSFATFVSWLLAATGHFDLRHCSSSWSSGTIHSFQWLWFTWGRDRTLGSTMEAGSVNLGRKICALWLKIQIYLSFIITRGQKLILGAKSPFINNYWVSVHWVLSRCPSWFKTWGHKENQTQVLLPWMWGLSSLHPQSPNTDCVDTQEQVPAKCLLKAVAQFFNNQDT